MAILWGRFCQAIELHAGRAGFRSYLKQDARYWTTGRGKPLTKRFQHAWEGEAEGW